MKPKIEAYETTNRIRRRVNADRWFAVESVVDPGTVYVKTDDEWAVMQSGITVRIPDSLVRELAEIAAL
jgi:hypothetical protein